MNKELPIYNLIIDESVENSGVQYVAMVDKPAIISTWQKFDQMTEIKFNKDAERQIVSGAAMIADLPIYRRDDKFGEHYVKFPPASIEKIMLKFMKSGLTSNVNLMHDIEAKPDDVYIFESFLIDSSRGILTPKGFDELSDGSWFISMKVSNPTVWANIDKLTGFSVEGFFDMVHVDDKQEKDILKQIASILAK
jgi:hypothetical protein